MGKLHNSRPGSWGCQLSVSLFNEPIVLHAINIHVLGQEVVSQLHSIFPILLRKSIQIQNGFLAGSVHMGLPGPFPPTHPLARELLPTCKPSISLRTESTQLETSSTEPRTWLKCCTQLSNLSLGDG